MGSVIKNKFNRVKFANPYKCEANWFIRLYKLSCYRDRAPLSYFSYAFSLFFDVFAFFVVARGIKLEAKAQIEGRRFTIRATNSQFHSIYSYEKCYEPDVYSAIELFLPDKGGVFVDIGSNWGHHTFIAAILKSATVYAFEPNKFVFHDLVGISDDLNCRERVKAFNFGLGSSRSRQILSQTRFESGTASVSKIFLSERVSRIHWPEKFMNIISFRKPIEQKIDIYRLDDIIPAGIKIDLIKIDAEGFEYACLRGMERLLEAGDATILFELHTDANATFEKYYEFFGSLNYKLYEIVANVDREVCKFIPVVQLEPSTQYNLLATKCDFIT